VTADTETMSRTDAESLRGLFDAVVETDVTDEGRVHRFHREGERTAWEPLPDTKRVGTGGHTGRRGGHIDVGRVEGLSTLIDRVASTGYTLTVFAPASRDDLDDIRAFFERQNVTVETVDGVDGGPLDFAVLHRDGDYHAAAPVGELRDSVALDGIEEAPSADSSGGRLLDSLGEEAFSADAASVPEMVRISRSIGGSAWAAGSGSLHAGFQRLSRVADDRRTRRVYEGLADRGVDVHLYGLADNDAPLDERFAVYDDATEEIADSWFALFDGGDGRRRGLVCEEHDERRYSGFWTFDDRVVEAAVDYLRRTY
jgi:hypothetical protein